MSGIIRPPPWHALPVVLIAAGCHQPAPEDRLANATVRDSAGIEIVENHAPQWGSEDSWTLHPEPEFVIGGYRGVHGATNDSSHLVWDIMGVAPLSDGRLAMVSAGERRVLLFERSGAFSNAIGREGRGPGEFFGPEHLQILPGDTVVVWDAYFGRVSYFHASGRLLRERSIDLGAVIAATRTPGRKPPETVHRPLPDGSFLVEARRADWERPADGSLYREPIEYVRIDSAYSVHSFGWWDGWESLSLQDPRATSSVPFATGSTTAAGGSPLSVYVTNGDSYEVQQFAPSGHLRRIIRRSAEPIPVSSGELAEWRELVSELNEWVVWPSWDRAMGALPPRRYHPPIQGLHVDTEGYLWVLDGSSLLGAGEWSVFAADGHWLGRVQLPVGIIRWIGEDVVIGGRIDFDLGTETIEGYRLSRQGT